MRKIVLNNKHIITVELSVLNQTEPIFAMKNGEFKGMLIKETQGWICRTGGSLGINGHHNTRTKCIESCESGFGYEFFVN